jgi:uncharacterized membrane protein YfcA
MLYALFGLVFGVVGGMGLGGGIVLIPALTLLMDTEQHTAQGMTLFAYLPMALAALVIHIRQKQIRLKPVLFLTGFGCAGGVAGYFLASVLAGETLRVVFAVFLIGAALLRAWRQEIGPRLKKRREGKPPLGG